MCKKGFGARYGHDLSGKGGLGIQLQTIFNFLYIFLAKIAA
jgi:hypothetical protein